MTQFDYKFNVNNLRGEKNWGNQFLNQIVFGVNMRGVFLGVEREPLYRVGVMEVVILDNTERDGR